MCVTVCHCVAMSIFVCSVEYNLSVYLCGWECVCASERACCVFLCTVLTLNVNWDTLIHFFCWPLSLFCSFISTFYLAPSSSTGLKPMRATVHSRKRSEPFRLLFSSNHPMTNPAATPLSFYSPALSLVYYDCLFLVRTK